MNGAELVYTSYPKIMEALGFFKTGNLIINEVVFRQRIEDYKNNRADTVERYRDITDQNLHMVQFFWGHDHDFGTFKEFGLMGTRHIWMLSRCFDHFEVSIDNAISGKNVLDVGCWTGGVSMVLNRLGANVVSIDEIHKYVDCLNFVVNSFGLKNFEAYYLSLYEMPSIWHNHFDTVCFFGVLYHLSDPIIGLRRIYQVLKPGGTLMLETMAIDNDQKLVEYQGPGKRNGQFGWNWFVPSPQALKQMLTDTGFTEIKVGNGLDEGVTRDGDPMGSNRCFAVAKKLEKHVLCQAGLSVPIF